MSVGSPTEHDRQADYGEGGGGKGGGNNSKSRVFRPSAKEQRFIPVFPHCMLANYELQLRSKGKAAFSPRVPRRRKEAEKGCQQTLHSPSRYV